MSVRPDKSRLGLDWLLAEYPDYIVEEISNIGPIVAAPKGWKELRGWVPQRGIPSYFVQLFGIDGCHRFVISHAGAVYTVEGRSISTESIWRPGLRVVA